MNNDAEQLKLLTTFHYVVGALVGLFSCFPVIHLVIGIAFVLGGGGIFAVGEAPPPFFGWVFIGVALFIITLGWTLAVNVLIAGKCLARRIRYNYCFVVACVMCIFMPFGTVLGVFTIVVLSRDSVKATFTR